ncbi:MAG TPA: hypothetical protein VGJ94_00105 [Syntrophorhabdaceae bacterium]
MKRICKAGLLISALFLILTGCAHEYVWTEYPIDPGRVASWENFTGGREINVTKGKSKDSKILLLNHSGTQYYASEQQFADGIADQLTKELRSRRVKITDTAGKSLQITVDSIDIDHDFMMLLAAVEFKVAFGNGKTKTYRVRNGSPGGFDRTCSGAVALAVIEIINDPEVLAYING